MARDTDKSRLFTRRAVLVAFGKVSLFSLLFGRLYYLQVLQKDRFSVLAEDNRINLRLIGPSRGKILDRSGSALATNQQNYRVIIVPEQVKDLDRLIAGLKAYVDLDEDEEKRIRRDFKFNDGLTTVLVADNLTWDQVAVISLHIPELPGADIEVGEMRVYPYGETMAHLVGYVGPLSARDKERGRSDYAIPGFKIGKSGVEREYDLELRGRPGNVQFEVNARGRVVRELVRTDPLAGDDHVLTIDVGLQQMVQDRLKKEVSASAVVMDIRTGAVYALVSHPSFDPNLFSLGLSYKEWSRLNNSEYAPLLNKVLDGMYAPGSTFKIVTALAGMEAGVLDPKEKIPCKGYMELGTHRFHCWKRAGHGPMNFVEAMAQSCDVYFYEIGRRVGIDKIHAMAVRLGLGEETAIDLPHERSGLIPNKMWKLTTKASSWKQGETLISAIGQGFVLTTPMQLALMTARIANGGYGIRPFICRSRALETEAGKPWGEELGLDPKHIALVHKALNAVVNKPIGTARSSAAEDSSLTMAGKTGTSQVRRISAEERSRGVMSNDMLAWKERDHALFVGYAPVQKPRYAAAVVVDHGGSGSHTSAPIVRDILVECQKRNLGATRS